MRSNWGRFRPVLKRKQHTRKLAALVRLTKAVQLPHKGAMQWISRESAAGMACGIIISS
jgi:hypothetical protein